MDVVRRVVHDVGIVPGDEDRRVPLEAVAQVARRRAVLHLGVEDHVAGDAAAVVVAVDPAQVVARIDEVGLLGVDRDVPALGAGHRVPVLGRRQLGHRPRRHRDRAVVLLGAVDAVGELVVDGDPVELGRRLVVLGGPGLAAVHADVGAAVVPLHHDVGLLRVDPEVVVVGVRSAHPFPGGPGVDGTEEADVRAPDRVRIGRVGVDVAVVPAAREQFRLVAHLLPGVAVVLGAEDAAAAFRRCDDRPQTAAPRRRRGDADPAEDTGGQAALELLPGVAAVRRAEQAALVAAVDQGPGLALDPPGRGVEDAGIEGVELQVGDPGVVRDVEHLLPGCPAIG